MKRWHELIPRGTVTYGVRMCELGVFWGRFGFGCDSMHEAQGV